AGHPPGSPGSSRTEHHRRGGALLFLMTAERELVGNSAQDGDLAWVRLTVSGQRIVHARGEGPGMADLVREVEGRTLLEAASVPGRRLAADALHDALGPAVRAAPSDSR